MNKKYFVSYIDGYFPALHSFSRFQNYYLYPLLLAKEKGYIPVAIVKGGINLLRTDPHFEEGIMIHEYTNLASFKWLLFKYACKGSVFYINSHTLRSYCALLFTKVLGSHNIFMAHIHPVRTTTFRQRVFDVVVAFTSRVRLNNSEEEDFLHKRGVNKAKLFVVPIAVVPSSFELTETNYEKRWDVVYYGNTTHQKGIPTVIHAFQRIRNDFPDVKFHIVGSRGSYDPTPDIKSLGLEGEVKLHGAFRHGRELTELLNKFRVFALSTKGEGQCLAVYESALAGNALCLPNIMAFKGVFKDCALFHEVGDTDQLAENLRVYLKNPKRAKDDNTKARELIFRDYNEEKVKEGFLKLITF